MLTIYSGVWETFFRLPLRSPTTTHSWLNLTFSLTFSMAEHGWKLKDVLEGKYRLLPLSTVVLCCTSLYLIIMFFLCRIKLAAPPYILKLEIPGRIGLDPDGISSFFTPPVVLYLLCSLSMMLWLYIKFFNSLAHGRLITPHNMILRWWWWRWGGTISGFVVAWSLPHARYESASL